MGACPSDDTLKTITGYESAFDIIDLSDLDFGKSVEFSYISKMGLDKTIRDTLLDK